MMKSNFVKWIVVSILLAFSINIASTLAYTYKHPENTIMYSGNIFTAAMWNDLTESVWYLYETLQVLTADPLYPVICDNTTVWQINAFWKVCYEIVWYELTTFRPKLNDVYLYYVEANWQLICDWIYWQHPWTVGYPLVTYISSEDSQFIYNNKPSYLNSYSSYNSYYYENNIGHYYYISGSSSTRHSYARFYNNWNFITNPYGNHDSYTYLKSNLYHNFDPNTNIWNIEWETVNAWVQVLPDDYPYITKITCWVPTVYEWQ